MSRHHPLVEAASPAAPAQAKADPVNIPMQLAAAGQDPYAMWVEFGKQLLETQRLAVTKAQETYKIAMDEVSQAEAYLGEARQVAQQAKDLLEATQRKAEDVARRIGVSL